MMTDWKIGSATKYSCLSSPSLKFPIGILFICKPAHDVTHHIRCFYRTDDFLIKYPNDKNFSGLESLQGHELKIDRGHTITLIEHPLQKLNPQICGVLICGLTTKGLFLNWNHHGSAGHTFASNLEIFKYTSEPIEKLHSQDRLPRSPKKKKLKNERKGEYKLDTSH